MMRPALQGLPYDRSPATWQRMLPVVRAASLTLVLGSILMMLVPTIAAAQEVLNPRQGRFLVASKQIQDPRFKESVILLLSVEQGGAAGLIINKPSGTKLSSLFQDLRRTGAEHDRLYYGGPVEPRALLVLHRMGRSNEHMLPVLRDVFVSSDRDVLKRTLKKKRAGKEYRVFMGYAGWTVGQLDREIRRGDWHVVTADAATVFHEHAEKVWPTLIRKGEEIFVRKGDSAGIWRSGRRPALRHAN